MTALDGKLSRKGFLKSMLGFTAIAVTGSLFSACSMDEDTMNPGTTPVMGGDCATNGTTVSFNFNHGHSLTVTAAEVTTGTAITGRSIQGSAGHNHFVNITAANLATLNGNMGVTVSSTSGNGHTHIITINCA